MRKRPVQLPLVILIGLAAILLGNHLLSGRVGEGSAPKRAVVAPFRAAAAREGSGLQNRTRPSAFPVDSSEVRLRSPSIVNRQSPIGNPLVPPAALSSIQNPKSKIQNAYGRLPLSFEANHGQSDAQVRFLARGGGYTIFLTDDEAVLTLRKSSVVSGQSSVAGNRLSSVVSGLLAGILRFPQQTTDYGPRTTESVLRMKLVGASTSAAVTGADVLPGRSNYFIGNDPKKWRTNVPSYARVKYEGVYPGVDLVYYGNQRQLECDFVLAPGADPNQIKLSFAGADGMRVDAASGDLVLKVGDNEVRFHKPAFYQPAVAAVSSPPSPSVASASGPDARHSFPLSGITRHCSFVLASNNEVAFRVAGYDPNRALVIDPVLVYSTYLGGSDDDWGYGITVDSSGNAYVTGTTDSTDFPTANPFQATNNATATTGYPTAFVAKLNSTGSALVYSTYLGGSDEDVGFGIAVDSSGNAYVTGLTYSNDFPTANPFQGTCLSCNPSLHNSYNAFVAKLNPTGSALVYSTYLGGTHNDQGNGIAVDSSGNAYVTGWTNSSDIPTANPLQATYGGNGDAFVAKLNAAGSALVYSTYLGGSSYDFGTGIAVDSSGNAYVTGETWSTDFPTADPFQATCSSCSTGYSDVFVAKLNAAGSALVYSTYLGGSGSDYGSGIAVDSSGDAYVTGNTSSTDFPTANPLQATNKATAATGKPTAFIAELNSTGSALYYSTYLGGSSEDYGNGIAVDSSGNAYVTGYTTSTDFPTANPFQATCGGCTSYTDAFVAELNAAGSALVYSTYLGGSSDDYGNGIAVDSSGNAYVTGHTYSIDFPTANPLQDACGGCSNGSGDAFVAKISPGGAGPSVSLSSTSLTFGPQNVGATSAPQTVTVTNTGTANLTITSIATSANFGQTSNCAASVAASGSCTINVTFSPTAAGPLTGTLTITDNSNPVAGSTQTVSLSGTGTGPVVSLSSSSLTLSAQIVGNSSSAQTVTLTNTGNAPLTISSITASGDFSQTNTCGTTVSAGANCTISVTFKPVAGGTRTGTLSISDNAADSPQSVALSGTGQDFTLVASSGSSTSATVAPGQSATYTLSVAGEGGFNQSVGFTCTGAPSEATCSVSPSPVTAGSSATNITVSVATTAPSVSAPRSRPLPPLPPLSPGLRGLLMLASVLALMTWAMRGRNQPGVSRWQSTMVALAAGLLLTLALAGCGGGGGSGSTTTSNAGTPAGAYTLTVTGSTGSGSATLSHSVTLTLNVS